MARNGKIARLPAEIRSELNRRMDKGEEGDSVLAWLNGLAEVQKMLTASFDGAAITKQNLSEWRQGGFREWELRQEWLEQAGGFSESAFEMERVVEIAALPAKLAGVLAVRYAALLNTWNGEAEEKMEGQLRLLRGMVKDVALLQRILQRASQEEREVERELEERARREQQESKRRTLRILWSPTQRRSLVEAFGGGKHGERMADIIEAVENDLPIPEEEKAEGEPEKAKGRRLKAKRGKGQEETQAGEAAKAEAVVAGQTESDPVQAGPAQNKSRARRSQNRLKDARFAGGSPLPKGSEVGVTGQSQSDPVQAGQGESDPVKPDLAAAKQV